MYVSEENKKINKNPREKSGIFGILFWTWTWNLFKIGWRKKLNSHDLFDPLKNDQCDVLGCKLQKFWTAELESKKKRPNFFIAIFRCFFWEIFFSGILHAVNELIIGLGLPIIVGKFLQYFRIYDKISHHEAFVYASGVCLLVGLKAILTNLSVYKSWEIGTRMEIAIYSILYRKILRLNTTIFGNIKPTKIINLMVNCSRFEKMLYFIHYIWSTPISALIIVYILCTEIGIPGTFGVILILVIVPIQAYCGQFVLKYQLEISAKIAERICLINELISAIQFVKMYAWEKPFEAMITMSRKLQLKINQKIDWIRSIQAVLNLITERAAVYCTVIGMLLYGLPLVAEKLFVFYLLCRILSSTMTRMFTRGIAEIVECQIFAEKFQHLLMKNEIVKKTSSPAQAENFNSEKQPGPDIPYIDDSICDGSNNSDNVPEMEVFDWMNSTRSLVDENFVLKFINVTAKWQPDSSNNTLNNINMNLERGKIYLVIGDTGAGKSSLISAILGELNPIEGSVELYGNLSYAAREPWIFESTLRKNIIFGDSYNHQRYQEVVKVCGFGSDFTEFPQGDQTIVGEIGCSLTKEQKVRVNLARALYHQADIYIFDDLLSDIDASTCRYFFEECVEQYLSGKTRIFVCHQFQYIKKADGIILVERGSVEMFDNYIDLLAEYPEYSTPIINNESCNQSEESFSTERMGMQSSMSSIQSLTSDAPRIDVIANDVTEIAKPASHQQITSSRRLLSTFVKYLRLDGRSCCVLAVGFVLILTQLTMCTNDLFLALIISGGESSNQGYIFPNHTLHPHMPSYNYIYTGLISAILITSITSSLMFYAVCARINQNLHDRSFNRLVRTSVRYFCTHPIDRIADDFTKKIAVIDVTLPKALLDVAYVYLSVAGCVAIVGTTSWYSLVSIIPICCAIYFLTKVYVPTSRNIRELERGLRPQIMTHLRDTLSGLPTIRVSQAQIIQTQNFNRLMDKHSSAVHFSYSVNCAFAFFTDILCFIFITSVIIVFVTLDYDISGARVGLAISVAMGLMGNFAWGIQRNVDVSDHLVSVDEIMEYATLPPEDYIDNRSIQKKVRNIERGDHVKTHKIGNEFQLRPRIFHTPDNWPHEGYIKFHGVVVHDVRTNVSALKVSNLVVKPREKIGIFGTADAEISAFISAILRLDKIDGIIEIDGVNTGCIYLEDLRRNITVVNHNSLLFSGTLRINLDPFGEFTDSELWDSLEQVEMKNTVRDSGGLDLQINFNCCEMWNFTDEQKRLICLSRATLRNSKILIVDSIVDADYSTHYGSVIQQVLNNKFANCTVITVTNRLDDIMNTDKILVMENRQVVEYDHPYILINNKFSKFNAIIQQSGRAVGDDLIQMARLSYDNKYEEII